MPKQAAWRFALGRDADSAWGSVEGFYEDVGSSGRERLITIQTDTWGKTVRKEMQLRRGDGIAFYHTSRAVFSETDRFHKRPRISAIGTIKGVKQDGQEVTWLKVSIDRSVLVQMRSNPLVWTDENAELFKAVIQPGAVATFYEVPGAVWEDILTRVHVQQNDVHLPVSIASVASQLNALALGRSIGSLQDLRKQLKGASRTAGSKIFSSQTMFDNYAFHHGGRSELQFNIGFERVNEFDTLRYGVGFSLEPSRSLPTIEPLVPKILRFNEFLRTYPEEYSDMRMWNWTNHVRSADQVPGSIAPELVRPHSFIFLGDSRRIGTGIDFGIILDCFDRLLPLYEYVEGGGGTFPKQVPQARSLQFRPGCSLKPSLTTGESRLAFRTIELRHNDIQQKLYDELVEEHGPERVGAEISNGSGTRIDLVVKEPKGYAFYEIKIALSARSAIRQAIAQLLEYSLWPGTEPADKLIVVSEERLDAASSAFLKRLRREFRLPIEYRRVRLN